jgi:hypothetical protein
MDIASDPNLLLGSISERIHETMVHHEGILSLSRVFMHVGEGMVPDISIRNFTIRFNEVLGRCHISTSRDAKNVEPVKDNGLVTGLIKNELKVLWRTVKLDGQWFNGRLEELSCCRLRKVEDVRVGKGWSQCKGDCLSRHDEVLDLKALGLLVVTQRKRKVIFVLVWCGEYGLDKLGSRK